MRYRVPYMSRIVRAFHQSKFVEGSPEHLLVLCTAAVEDNRVTTGTLICTSSVVHRRQIA